ncbi:hypothetical protein E2C01_031741 [Portunus trituberculatus]|uniref:Uncharacterized protein n=1 Tax=Portunus trituberculatus TaxID=210409 RepID=A0A5B7F0W2_PORTR|nr:hypothetical protein [Portunus trituberculatus]
MCSFSLTSISIPGDNLFKAYSVTSRLRHIAPQLAAKSIVITTSLKTEVTNGDMTSATITPFVCKRIDGMKTYTEQKYI